MAEAIRVKGLAELQKAYRQTSRDISKELRGELRASGQIVRDAAQGLFSGIDARSAAGYKVRVRQRGVAVEQSLGRTTGQHPSYGALQMRRALLPALQSNQDKVIRGLEVMLDMVGRRNGF